MKVGHTGPSSIQGNEPQTAKGAERASAAPKPKTDRGASSADAKSAVVGGSADLSPQAKEFAKAREVATNTPDEREDKIAELKQRFASGTYKIDPHAISDKLVDEHIKGM